jgi:FtsP/CotA-like multicopper oxidase with cupredoxin domain
MGRLGGAAALCIGLVIGGTVVSTRRVPSAAATAPTVDETKVPHYFGPYPNWANSPQTLADAIVTITPATGDTGTGAEATATVDPATGGISDVTVTSPGSGFTVPPTVSIGAAGVIPTQLATATATISTGALQKIAVDESGYGFLAPSVQLSGGSPTTPATAVASGGIDNLVLASGGSGYQNQPLVRISLPDLPDGTQATASAVMGATGSISSVAIVDAGSGYTSAPTVEILDGNQPNDTGAAVVTASIGVSRIDVTAAGQGYSSAPAVSIVDVLDPANPSATPIDRGASATAVVASNGAVTGITVTAPGAGYLTPGLKKFVDTLSGLGPTAANDLGNYIPVAVKDDTTYPGSDYYEIAVVQYRQKFHRDLPPTLLRGYVQLSTAKVPGHHAQLFNEMLDGSKQPILLDGKPVYAVDTPHYLGPTIVASRNVPTRILFRNLLPTGSGGDLFLPVDTTLMGAGMGPNGVTLKNGVPQDMVTDQGTVTDGVRNPLCGNSPKPADCFTENRAELHLHGGITPWISDGTPHQWVTPAGDSTAYPKGVSVSNVPDMPDPGPGAETFFYTNQQSARLMFYHDHAWGITRLNVYAGEAAGYLLTDKVEQDLIGTGGALEGLGLGTPLVIQDKTFVSNDITKTDPTWNSSRWGGEGSLWIPHVYMPAQNPSSPTGQNPFGRWMYGSWFWPPAKNVKYPPIANPYYDSTCDPKVQPFCEPQMIPGTPNVTVGMESFNDTPIVNGTAYPTTTVDPKAYRYRILNAANDRFWNLQWYVADPTTGTLSEVALNPKELAAAQTDPNVVPTPDTSKSPAGPSWIQIGTEGGFLPTPTVVPNQPITWITDPTRFDVGNVDKHALLLAPAERADVIVDFSQFRGKTLILYNDAPAAFPARVSTYDYYTGDPDLSPVGAHSTLPGYGPNTRTIMQVKVSNATPAPAFDRPNSTNDRMDTLMKAFAHHLDGGGKPAGVFEKGSDPIIVGQAAYNVAYGTSFAADGWCNSPTAPTAKCDGYARIQEQGGDQFKFDTLNGSQLSLPFQPKGMHDEMNSASFDEYGRMTANLGLEAPGATPLLQNIILYPYVNPSTELLDASNLPSSLHVTPISSSADGTQIWKITHNGVDTHPIHFHLFDVQLINRVTWDGINIPPEPSELGWKDTVRVSPLEDTIVAVRPIVPTLPFGIPDSVRVPNPMMPEGAHGDLNTNGQEAGFNNTDTNGNPMTTPISNVKISFGWEYVFHCHILSHEEMDMMRPVNVHVPSIVPDAPVVSTPTRTSGRGNVDLQWTDGTPIDYADPTTWSGQKNEIGYRVERAPVVDGVVGTYEEVGTALANHTAFSDTPADPTVTYSYRVVAYNQAGDGTSVAVEVPGLPPAPSAVLASVTANGGDLHGVSLTWTPSTSPDVVSVVVERAKGSAAFQTIATLPATDPPAYVDPQVDAGSYHYRIHGVTGAAVETADALSSPDPLVIGNSTTALQATPGPLSVGDPVTFTAIVTATPALTTAASGIVTFTVDGVPADRPVSSGVASYTTSALAAGDHAVTADYQGDARYPASSDHLSVTIARRVTTLTVQSSESPAQYGDTLTYTATLGSPSVTGTVDLVIDAGTPAEVKQTAAPVNGVTAFDVAGLVVGTHTVTATYSGDASFEAVSAKITQQMDVRPTTTTATSSSNPSTVGQSVTFTASVSAPGSTLTPTGSVEFTIANSPNVAVHEIVPLDSNGVATLQTSNLLVGSHTVTVTYPNAAPFAASTGQLTQVVNKVPTTVSLSSSRSSSVWGQMVTLTARMSTDLAQGTVDFVLDGRVITRAVLGTAGMATVSSSTFAVGTHTVVAKYGGSALYAASTSAPLTLTVSPARSRLTVTSSSTTSTFRSAVTFTAVVTAVAPGVGTPTGNVQFFVDGVSSALAPLRQGRAGFKTSTLARGRHTVTAKYVGNPRTFLASTGSLAQRVV